MMNYKGVGIKQKWPNRGIISTLRWRDWEKPQTTLSVFSVSLLISEQGTAEHILKRYCCCNTLTTASDSGGDYGRGGDSINSSSSSGGGGGCSSRSSKSSNSSSSSCCCCSGCCCCRRRRRRRFIAVVAITLSEFCFLRIEDKNKIKLYLCAKK